MLAHGKNLRKFFNGRLQGIMEILVSFACLFVSMLYVPVKRFQSFKKGIQFLECSWNHELYFGSLAK